MNKRAQWLELDPAARGVEDEAVDQFDGRRFVPKDDRGCRHRLEHVVKLHAADQAVFG